MTTTQCKHGQDDDEHQQIHFRVGGWVWKKKISSRGQVSRILCWCQRWMAKLVCDDGKTTVTCLQPRSYKKLNVQLLEPELRQQKTTAGNTNPAALICIIKAHMLHMQLINPPDGSSFPILCLLFCEPLSCPPLYLPCGLPPPGSSMSNILNMCRQCLLRGNLHLFWGRSPSLFVCPTSRWLHPEPGSAWALFLLKGGFSSPQSHSSLLTEECWVFLNQKLNQVIVKEFGDKPHGLLHPLQPRTELSNSEVLLWTGFDMNETQLHWNSDSIRRPSIWDMMCHGWEIYNRDWTFISWHNPSHGKFPPRRFRSSWIPISFIPANISICRLSAQWGRINIPMEGGSLKIWGKSCDRRCAGLWVQTARFSRDTEFQKVNGPV